MSATDYLKNTPGVQDVSNDVKISYQSIEMNT